MHSAFINRARHALDCIRNIKEKPGEGDYLRAVRGLPAEIRQVGLGQALAILFSRGKSKDSGHRCLYSDIEQWMLSKNPSKVYTGGFSDPKLLHAIIGTDDQQKYRLAMAEADEYLAVLKRLAEIFLSAEAAAPAAAPPQVVSAQ